MSIINLLSAENITRKYVRKIYLQSILFMLIVFLAYSRWMPGGGNLTPQEGLRGKIEAGLVLLTFLFVVISWGINSVLAGFKLSSFVYLILFGMWAAFSALWSPNPILSLGKACGLILITLLASAIAYQSARLNFSIVKVLFTTLILLIVFLFIINLVEFNNLLRIDTQINRPRLILAYDQPNVSASMFVVALLAGAYLLMNSQRITHWLAILLLVFLLAILLYLTDSRASMLSFFVSIGLLFSSRLKPDTQFSLLLFLTTILVSGILFFVLLENQRLLPLNLIVINPEWLTLNGRLGLWKFIINNLSISSIFGVGYAASRYIILEQFSWGINSHNSYLEVFLTTGVVGFVLLIAFYISSISLLKNWRAYPLPFILLIYSTITSMVEVRLFWPGILMFATCTFIFHQQFMQQIKRNGKTQDNSVNTTI